MVTNLIKVAVFYTLTLVEGFSPISSLGRARRTSQLLYNVKSEDVATVQILMSDTGGGHRASANALRDAFDVLYPGKISCDIVDIYTEYGPFWPYNSYVEGYKLMAKYPITWEIFYRFGETPIGLWLNELFLELFCFEPFKNCLERPSATGKRADMVVSVHPLTQDLPLKILAHLDSNGATREMSARNTPFCTVVTDLGSAHPTWFNKNVDFCFVPSDALNKAAQARGLKNSQIVQYGLPIRKGFWSTQQSSVSKEDLREELGIHPDLPTALVVGGGDGMGGIVKIAKEMGKKLASARQTCQLVVVCGKNEDAKRELKSCDFGPGVEVCIQGFVDNMDEWMKASDALVTKAGPGTIAEASICGLPCMMFSFLPGQEEGNIPFVENAGFGKYSGDPSEIAEIVSTWLENPETLESMQDAALAASRPQATLDIAKDLAEILFTARDKKIGAELVKVRKR